MAGKPYYLGVGIGKALHQRGGEIGNYKFSCGHFTYQGETRIASGADLQPKHQHLRVWGAV